MANNLQRIDLPKLNKQWLTNLPPAFVSAIIITITSTAAVSIIFHGNLAPYLPIGVSCALIGAVVVNLISKFVCVFPFAVSCMTPNAAVLMGIYLGELGELNIPQDEIFYTVFAAFILTSLFTGLFLTLIGSLRLGKLIRFMPFPVLCGFFAGVGWYLFMGAFTVVGVDITSIGILKDQHFLLTTFIPTIGFSVFTFIFQRQSRNPTAYFLIIITAVLLFYILLWANHLTLNDATKMGLTLKGTNISFIFDYINTDFLSKIHWHEIFSRSDYILTFAVVNLLSLLAYAVNFEQTSNTTADLDREVKHMGISNMISACLTGGTAIFTTQSLTHRATGANHSISILYVSLFCLFILLFNDYIIRGIPKFIFSAILIINGMFLIHRWLIKVARKVSKGEWFIISLIFLFMIFQGFIYGVAFGLALAFLQFIVNNSTMNIIRYEISGADYHSNATYPSRKLDFLKKHGGKIHVLKLQGFFFFGSAEKLYSYVNRKILKRTDPQVEYLIIDFQFVTDLDSTASNSILKLHQLLVKNNCTLILTGLNYKTRKHLKMVSRFQNEVQTIPSLSSLEFKTKSGKIYIFEDMDFGLEWAEKRIIADLIDQGRNMDSSSLLSYREFFETEPQLQTLLSHLKKITLNKDDILRTTGQKNKCLYFINSGKVAYMLKRSDGRYKRIREYEAGHVVGEIEFFLDESFEDIEIICIEESSFYKLDHKKLQEFGVEYPDIAVRFSEWLMKVSAERMAHIAHEVKLLL